MDVRRPIAVRDDARRAPWSRSFAACALGAGVLLAAAIACGPSAQAPAPVASRLSQGPASLTAEHAAFLDSLERRTFQWFWDLTPPGNGLTPDRWPTESFSSVAAVGFALTAYPIGAERGWITRAQARERVVRTLEFFRDARQDSAVAGATGYRGLYYHFLDPRTGARFRDVELSTIDTALLLAGALFCQSYFDRPDEAPVRDLVELLYRRAEWNWAQPRRGKIALGWTPEGGFLPYDWGGYNEVMILMVLALGSPTHAPTGDVWGAYAKSYRWGSFYGQEHVNFAPLFGHQYSHAWVDYRGIQDAFMRTKGLDYFENSRRATLAQHAYARANPGGWTGYGDSLWGLTACDGPLDGKVVIGGKEREFKTYWARGAALGDIRDDGTVAPTAAAGSIPFAPEIAIPTLVAMRNAFGARAYTRYGFVDALNPTLKLPIKVQHGVVDTALGWFDGDQLGIDQGPIVCMIENHRSGFVWDVMRKNPHVARGLKAAGFTGGWLDSTETIE